MPDRIPRDDLTDLERQLAALRPTADRLDRDRMLFEAGRASARADGRAWAFSAAASAMVALGLGVALARERSRALGPERALVAASQTAPSPPVASQAPPPVPARPIEVAPDSYLALSRRAFASLDDPRPAPTRPPGRPEPAVPDRPLSPLRSRSADGLRDL